MTTARTLSRIRLDLLDELTEADRALRKAQGAEGLPDDSAEAMGVTRLVVAQRTRKEKLRGSLASLDSKIRGSEARPPDLSIREFVIRADEREMDMPVEARDLLRPTGVSAGSDDFVSGLMGALVDVVPLLGLATVITSSRGGDLDLNYVASQPAVAGIVAEATAVGVTSPTFGEVAFANPFKHPAHIRFSTELLEDWAFDLDAFVIDRAVPTLQRTLANNLWRGVGGTTAPAGLATAATTVAAAGAAVVTFADIENLIENVPAAYRTGGRFAIVMSPGAYMDLRIEKDSAGNFKWPPGAPDVLYGATVYQDNALAAPASAARSVVAGDFAAAYAIRMLPVRFAMATHNSFNAGLVNAMVTLRADGRTMITSAVRALLHP